MIFNRKIEVLKLEFEKKEMEKKVGNGINKKEKIKWYEFFFKKKN